MGNFCGVEGDICGVAEGFQGYFEGIPWPMPGNMPRQQAAIGCRGVRTDEMEFEPGDWIASKMPQCDDVRMSSTDEEDAH
ncbi:hypothetical protein HY30_16450 [Hyphomonas chukchiensis]|uniref:Uncharacterized protein n=1 Tax=Hyphomonas chukchiensis TaxID=1280947 RepID=A0A062UMP4_9PROT|nr:hypothetical protein HY30_16450 [Hyphomonas chukchiensis]